MDDPGPIGIFATIPALFLVAAYIALGIFCAKSAWWHTSWIERQWVRRLISSFVLAVFFAPGLIGFGTGTEAGVGPTPIWAMLFQNRDLPSPYFYETVRAALISFTTTWIVFLVVGMLRANMKKQHGQTGNPEKRD